MKKRNEEKYVKHTYRFYKDRRNDPKWRPIYLKERQKRIMWTLCTTLAILFISALAFFGYTYSNANSGKNVSTAAFEKTSSSSSSSTSSSSTPPSSSSSVTKKELKTMDDLDLNNKIALLAQAYYALNPNSTILEAPNLCMSDSWDNGPIEWYDNQGAKHKLNVRVDGDAIIYSYKDPVTGQQTAKTTSVNASINSFLGTSSAMQANEQIAAKVVAPANLTPPTGGKGMAFAGPAGEIYAQIFNKGFRYSLIKYDGMDVDTAMKNGAPQNLIHDGTFYYYFLDTNQVETTAIGAYNPKSIFSYEISDSELTLSPTIKIPIEERDGKRSLKTTFEKKVDGHTLTYEFIEDSTAKNYIDSKT